MYGRHPRLPVDIAFGLDMGTAKQKSMASYTSELKDRLTQAYDIASIAARKSQSRNKNLYDQKARAAILEKGDRVLVKVVAFDGKHKLADKWEQDIYVILDQPNPSIPVFVLGKENGQGRTRTLHRNLLLPIGSLPHSAPVPKPRKCKPPQPKPTVRQTPREDTTGSTGSEDGVDEGEDIMYISTQHSDSSGSVLYQADRPLEDKLNEDTEDADRADFETKKTVDAESQEQHSEEFPVPPVDVLSDAEPAVQPADVLSDTETPVPPVDAPPDREPAADVPVQPEPRPRRSVRDRRPPSWMSRGEFALSAVTQPDWLARANYLSSLIEEGVLEGQPKRLSDALLDLVTGKNK
ncbi:uncharacterized protein [Haliotis asinina]|uniref:uncharacterized protein n=1 Tax=Haliotis asinina TaxID=109174 RepID=UPI003531CA60